MSIELIRDQRDKYSGELYSTPPNGKCPIQIRTRSMREYIQNCTSTSTTYASNKYPNEQLYRCTRNQNDNNSLQLLITCYSSS